VRELAAGDPVVLDDDLLIGGENLTAMAALPAGTFDVIYLDPPFNTGSERRLRELAYDDRFGDYAGFLRPRLERARELLAEHGTLYLHLDYREAHRAKLLLDELFGEECFLNELIWIYDYGGRPRRRWPAKHDTILVYVRDRRRYHFDDDEVDREPYMAPGLVGPEKAARGKRPSDCWWHTIVPTNSRERTGYPTQKPLGIVRRMIAASSRPGGWCLDPFAGSGTAGVACRELGRRFVLVDSNPEAIAIARSRLVAGEDAPGRLAAGGAGPAG
jgi:site-specific DNA-methyltransferase (adenine-specific)